MWNTRQRLGILGGMSDVTRVLSRIETGDPAAAELLLPLVYDELRKLAAAKLAQEKPGQTLQATALVHEAYLRLVVPHKATTSGRGSLNSELKPEGPAPQLSSLALSPQPPASPAFDSRGHFFASAEAMRGWAACIMQKDFLGVEMILTP